MSGVSFAEVSNARKEAATLRSQLRDRLKAVRAEAKSLKAEIIESKSEDRAAYQTKALADGGKRIGCYVVKTSGKRFTLIPDNPAVPVTKGEAVFLTAILSTLNVA